MFADEGATLYSGRLSWSDLWAQSQHVDLVLLPYYVLIHVWMMVSGNIAWVRALSLFAFFGTIVVIGWTGLRIAGRWCGIIASVLTATSALLVEKSLNARPYELSSFVVVLCAVALFRWLEDSRARWLWAFSFLTLVATAMQLFSLLAPVAMLLCVLVVRPELIAHRVRGWLAPVALLAVVSCAWVVACIGEVGQVNWIANASTGTRLLAEVRGPVVGQFYDFILIVIAVVCSDQGRRCLVWRRTPCHRRTCQPGPGRSRPHCGLGGHSDARSVARVVRPSDLFGSIRRCLSSRSGPAGRLRVCANLPENPRPSPLRGRVGTQETAAPSDGGIGRRSGRPPHDRVFRISVSAAGRPGGPRGVRRTALGARGRHRPAGPCDHLGHWLLPDERPEAHSALAATRGSATIRGRFGPRAAPVGQTSQPSLGRGRRQRTRGSPV